MKHVKNNNDRIVAAVDIGATKVCCGIARISERGDMDVLSVGTYVSRGVRKGGGLVDLEALSNSISHAVHNAESAAGFHIPNAYIALPAGLQQSHVVGEQMTLYDQPIEDADIQSLLSEAQVLLAMQDQEILHAIPMSFQLDDQKGIRDPRGMYGSTLSVKLHLLTTARSVVRNITACVARSHVEIASIVATPYATALSTLVEDEMELGTTVIELGGGTTTLIGFINGVMTFCETIPLGGLHITNDIARMFSTSLHYAERVKTLYGSAFSASIDGNEVIAMPQIGDALQAAQTLTVTKKQINQIIQPRLDEIFAFVAERLSRLDPDGALGRIVLTGGGAGLNGMIDYVAQTLGRKHIRIAIPSGFEGVSNLGPELSTCAGLLKFAHRDLADRGFFNVTQGASGSWWDRVRGLWSD